MQLESAYAAGAGVTIMALTTVVKVMKVVIERNKGDIIEKLLKNPYTAIIFGGVVTFLLNLVQLLLLSLFQWQAQVS